MKIVVLDGYAANPGDISWEPLRSLGDAEIYDRTPPEKLAQRISGAEIVIANKTPMGEELFSQCPKLRYIGLTSTGYNIIDLDAARRHGITVCNVPAYSTAAVVQHTFALLFEMCAHTGPHSRAVSNGEWSVRRDFCFWDKPLIELAGKTLGVIGFGQIGTGVAMAATAFGMNVLACAKHERVESGIAGVKMADFETLLRRSDIISLHCPLTPESANMISAETIAMMKNRVMILNTARGGLVSEPDLAKALKAGKVAAFGADVLTQEPPVAGSPLIGAPNTVITPHIAWAPFETRQRLMDIATENVRAFLDGRP